MNKAFKNPCCDEQSWRGALLPATIWGAFIVVASLGGLLSGEPEGAERSTAMHPAMIASAAHRLPCHPWAGDHGSVAAKGGRLVQCAQFARQTSAPSEP